MSKSRRQREGTSATVFALGHWEQIVISAALDAYRTEEQRFGNPDRAEAIRAIERMFGGGMVTVIREDSEL